MASEWIWRAALLAAIVLFAAPELRAAEEEHPAILLVAFGTTNDGAKAAYDNIEAKVRAAFPDSDVTWAYSSSIVRRRLGERGIRIAEPGAAAAELVGKGAKTLLVQSLHIVPGEEHAKTVAAITEAAGDAEVAFGRPLLWNAADIAETAEAVFCVNAAANASDTAVLWMGHGQESGWADSNYLALEYQFRKQCLDRVFIALVEGEMDFESALPRLKASGAKKVVLAPFMMVAGVHVQEDLIGDEEDSWKSVLTGEGYTVCPALTGLGEMDAIAAIYVRHLKEAQASLE